MPYTRLKNCLLLLPLLYLLSACSIDEPEFLGVSDIEVISANTKNIVVEGKAHFHNPNNTKLTIKEVNVEVEIDGNAVGKVMQTLEQEVDKNADFSLPLRIDFPPSKIFDNLLSSMMKMTTGQKFKVRYNGYARAKAHGITVKVPVKSTQEVNIKF
jgi:LEA14-like dessication related protein